MSNVNGKFDATPTESETTRTVGNFSHGSRETPETSASPMEVDRSEKARGHTSDRHVCGESDSPIVPGKPANNGRPQGQPPAELVEGRGLTEENAEPLLRVRTQRRHARSRGGLGVREAARRDKRMRFNNAKHPSSAASPLTGTVKGELFRPEEASRARTRRGDVGRVRGGAGTADRRSARTDSWQ